MKTTSGILRKRIENNESLATLVTNENIHEAIAFAKLQGFDPFKIIDQLDRKQCKASVEHRLAVIMNDQDLHNYFRNNYIVVNNEIRESYLTNTFYELFYKTHGLAGLKSLFGILEDSKVYQFIIAHPVFADEFISLANGVDITANYSIDYSLTKLIELHEATK